jgi:hypothetical protein
VNAWTATQLLRAAENVKAKAFCLPPDQQTVYDEAYRSIQGPRGFTHHRSLPLGDGAFKSAHLVNMAGTHTLRWLAAFVFNGPQYETMRKLSDLYALLSRRSLSHVYRVTLVDRVSTLVSDLEQALPVTMHSRMLHGCVELARLVAFYGPARGWWMFAYERSPCFIISHLNVCLLVQTGFGSDSQLIAVDHCSRWETTTSVQRLVCW